MPPSPPALPPLIQIKELTGCDYFVCEVCEKGSSSDWMQKQFFHCHEYPVNVNLDEHFCDCRGLKGIRASGL